MASLATMETRLETLRAAYDSGALTVRHGDQSVTYRSASEMERVIRRLEGDIAVAGGTTRRRTRYLYQSGKGL